MDGSLSRSCSNAAFKLSIPLIIGFLWSQGTYGQSNLQDIRMASLRGRCIRVMVAGRDLPAKCSPDPANAALLNINYPDSRSGFYIATDGFVLTFSGMGSQQIKNSADSVVQPVDSVIFSQLVNDGPIQPTKLRALGTCSFENPTKGVPTKIECNAKTEQGQFALEFLHNGEYPEYMGR
jgi:hypothetical protein